MVTDGTTATPAATPTTTTTTTINGHPFHQPSPTITTANQVPLYHQPIQHVKSNLSNDATNHAFYFSVNNTNNNTLIKSEQDQPIVSSQQGLNEQQWVTPNPNYLTAKYNNVSPSTTTSPSSSTSAYNNISNNQDAMLSSYTGGMVTNTTATDNQTTVMGASDNANLEPALTKKQTRYLIFTIDSNPVINTTTINITFLLTTISFTH
ncbi:hypothetical protein BDF20DRAFT_875151 [Mycotypha africana]|uniref:uncharacterized protein n=1 Tax=Mycotypha africana TaxID=64632 RepID=UPI002300EB1A|nr:uncharacterized protein BDF20DRAFT_875151 [Mycotypha africana]KAI8977488.1 hypothetical protein BDF20DRAFT_875151 [Mycotypha africana]